MIRKPYSDIAAEAFNAAEFPALKHFWHCKQPGLTTGGAIIDIVGGADFSPGVINSTTDTGINILAATGWVPAAPLTPLELASCILIACGDWGGTTAGFLYGNATATSGGLGGINVGNASTGAKASDGTNALTVVGGAPTQSAGSFTRVTTLDATQMMNFETSSSALEATPYANVTARGSLGSIAAVADTIGAPTANPVLYGAALFKFAGALPPQEQIMAMAAWCDYQWRNNANICMYPGFKGLA